ncbi:MAG: hypothetical protein HYT12_04825 [Candidatus Liptonbacteria bacterium]|nr:hypothetical protein [Candidatus Liptonbacteria bacterium]
MEPQIQLSKKERKAFKRQEKLETRERKEKSGRLKKLASWSLWSGLTLVLMGSLIWYVKSLPETSESDILSRSGFHWHPELQIYVKGEKLMIPANIGLGTVHQPIHTHNDDNDRGIIHMEFAGRVRKQDTTLGRFFLNWGKDIRSFGANLKMAVNGTENAEYENYVMHDGDKIELHYDE